MTVRTPAPHCDSYSISKQRTFNKWYWPLLPCGRLDSGVLNLPHSLCFRPDFLSLRVICDGKETGSLFRLCVPPSLLFLFLVTDCMSSWMAPVENQWCHQLRKRDKLQNKQMTLALNYQMYQILSSCQNIHWELGREKPKTQTHRTLSFKAIKVSPVSTLGTGRTQYDKTWSLRSFLSILLWCQIHY